MTQNLPSLQDIGSKFGEILAMAYARIIELEKINEKLLKEIERLTELNQDNKS